MATALGNAQVVRATAVGFTITGSVTNTLYTVPAGRFAIVDVAIGGAFTTKSVTVSGPAGAIQLPSDYEKGVLVTEGYSIVYSVTGATGGVINAHFVEYIAP